MHFNSIKVQLEHLIFLRRYLPDLVFQFHKGTIRTSTLLNRLNAVLAFQFHKGTIRTITRLISDIPTINFNSIKVQLEHDRVHHVVYALSFQFHKGTIRTCLSMCEGYQYSPFQFHKGTIRTTSIERSLNTFTNFNSIKVQLELNTFESS